jgi:peptidoglycan/xylan/chitin deacetylase (PgdA/CDA1 family)
MTPRWNWDFEEDKPRVSAPTLPAAPPVPPAPPPRPTPAERADSTRYGLRRGVAALALALLVGLILALSGSSHHRPARAGGTRSAQRVGAKGSPPGQPAFNADHAVAATLAYTPFVREGSREVRDVALTFDDGPGPYTPAVLSVLEAAHAQATFFAIGRMERYFSESTARELRDGDVVGDHTEGHLALARLSAHEQHEEIFEALARLELLGPRPRLFRPPYGSFNATTFDQLRSLGLLMVLWSSDTGDYQLPGVPVIVQRALEGAHPGAIILMHDGGGDRSQTVAALPQIIHDLRARGYQLVTVPKLLADDPPPRGLPLPTSLAGD